MRFLLWEFSVSFYIFHRCRVWLVDHVDLIFSLYNWWEGFGSSFSATLPLFQLWFYVRLYMWMVHWGLLLRLPWRIWVCLCEGQVWSWCSCLGLWQHQYLGELAARAAGNIVL